MSEIEVEGNSQRMDDASVGKAAMGKKDFREIIM
jgi:hypothetical protein